MTVEPEYFTVDDGAAWSGLSTRSLRRAIKAGLIPALRVNPSGGVGRPRILLRRTDLRAFIESSARVTTTTDTARAIVARVMAGRR